jgi:hypothetical protein
MKPLPEYEPPNVQRACVAAGVSPLLVLLVFTALVSRLIDVETAMAWFAGCTAWVVYEMWEYQRQEDAYNADYEVRYLRREPTEVLESWARREDLAPPTRTFLRQVAKRRHHDQRPQLKR